MTQHVWRPVISKTPFQRASTFIKTNDTKTFYIYISLNDALQWFFRLMRTNNENAFLYTFLKTFKRPSFHCPKFADSKPLWESSNLYKRLIWLIKTGGLFIRFFAKAVTKSSKIKKWKIKKLRFWRAVKSIQNILKNPSIN